MKNVLILGWRLSASALYYRYTTRDRTHDENVASDESQKTNISIGKRRFVTRFLEKKDMKSAKLQYDLYVLDSDSEAQKKDRRDKN